MKTLTIIALFISTLFLSCKSGDNLSKAERIANITEKVESGDYTFVPQTVLPMGGKAVDLNYSFYLKVRKDTIESHLPYYGRAYVAPFPSENGGITFVSTDFNYTISDKEKGTWNAHIGLNDSQKRHKLSLKIGDTGYTTLTVLDNNRQSISFYGKIE